MAFIPKSFLFTNIMEIDKLIRQKGNPNQANVCIVKLNADW